MAVDDLVAALNKLAAELPLAGARVVTRSQVVMEAAAKKQFVQSHRRGTPSPAAHGKPPAVVTGTLRRSIISDKPETKDGVTTGHVYPTTVYARIQELGGTAGRRHSAVLPARPYMRPAQQSISKQVRAIQREEFAAILPRG